MDEKMLPDWEALYNTQPVETMPWFTPDLDQDFDRILQQLRIQQGTVLDVGAGPGTQAMALARRGLTVVATDISSSAIRKAQARVMNQGLAIIFLQDDILHTTLTQVFDLILDRGCFHVFHPDQRARYVRNVHRLLKPDARLLLKCFSQAEPGTEGPYRFSAKEIREYFAPLFTVQSIEESVFRGTRQPAPQALCCVMQKRAPARCT